VQRYLISGGTGFIGGQLVQELLHRDATVRVLTRDAAHARQRLPSAVEAVEWDPGRGVLAPSALDGVDVVVHLAGEQAVGTRYTDEVKQRIRESRVASTRLLVQAMQASSRRPRAFISGSAVGYYGARSPDEVVDETSAAGTDFLASVTVDWEAAAEPAVALGVRVVLARFGIVLGPGGGALERMALPFKMFVGGPIGSGRQAVSWIHIRDVVRALVRCATDAAISGPVNVVAPRAATNAELSRAIGAATGRPSWLPVPTSALRALFGEGAVPLLTGQRAVPAVLQRAGFSWDYPELGPAVAAALNPGPAHAA
jgi:hypothetical protein